MEDVEKALPNVKSANLARMMLKQLKLKEIDIKEYLEKCAYWGMKTLDDIYFMSLPSRPLEVIAFEQLSYYKRSRLTREYFTDHPEVMKYYEQKRWVETQNETSLCHLKEIKKYMPESEVENHEKLDKRILDFKMKMEDY